MWTALKHVHKEKGHQTAIAAQCALFRTCAEEGDNIEEHLMKLKGCWEHIWSLEVEDFMVNDVQFKAIISTLLPPSWDSYTEPYVGQHKGETAIDAKKLMGSQEFIGIIKEEYCQ